MLLSSIPCYPVTNMCCGVWGTNTQVHAPFRQRPTNLQLTYKWPRRFAASSDPSVLPKVYCFGKLLLKHQTRNTEIVNRQIHDTAV